MAKFMPRDTIDLEAPVIKVVTMHSAKGLEFPIVAVAGLGASYPSPAPSGATEDQIEEAQQLGRRALYVAMTRAMDRLLVVVPEKHQALSSTMFDSTFWDVDGVHLTSGGQIHSM
jgi:superfamily I DNA/RNA helicase